MCPEIDETVEGKPPADPVCRREPIRILMLHGFTFSGEIMEIKSRPFVQRLTKVLANHYQRDEKDIEYIYPDAPVQLSEQGVKPSRELNALDVYTDTPAAAQRSDQGVKSSTKELNVLGRGWCRIYDNTGRYTWLETSLAFLASLTQTQGPFKGVVAFSQGAVMAGMFTSWCEMDVVPGRREALQRMCERDHNAELTQILATPPQAQPLDFAVLFSGWIGTWEYYHGFYDPPILTPAVHAFGTFDTLIPRCATFQFVSYFQRTKVVEHPGTHFVPRYGLDVDNVANALAHLLAEPWPYMSLPLLRSQSSMGRGGGVGSSGQDPHPVISRSSPLKRPLPVRSVSTPLIYDDSGYNSSTSVASLSEAGCSTPGSQSRSGSRGPSRNSSRGGLKIVRRYKLANAGLY